MNDAHLIHLQCPTTGQMIRIRVPADLAHAMIAAKGDSTCECGQPLIVEDEDMSA